MKRHASVTEEDIIAANGAKRSSPINAIVNAIVEKDDEDQPFGAAGVSEQSKLGMTVAVAAIAAIGDDDEWYTSLKRCYKNATYVDDD